jgi:ribonuclease Z
LKIIFLGTGGSIPTSNRGAPAVALVREGEIFLLDCGEGTQQKMFAARLGFNRPTKILITHLHGDHLFGLPGLLQTMSLLGRVRPIQIFGPRKMNEFLTSLISLLGEPKYPLEVKEIVVNGKVCDGKGYTILAISADHNKEAWSYALVEEPRPGKFHPDKAKNLGIPMGPLWKNLQQWKSIKLFNGRTIYPEEVVNKPRPGRKIVYSGDTRPNEDLIKFAEGADLLIHESTFGDELTDKANIDGHSTPSQAAEIARRSRVKKLVLTHISSRYLDSKELLKQARRVFKNTKIAEDLMEISIPYKN